MTLVAEFLARTAPFDESALASLIATAPLRYKVYDIKKRRGRGKRTIAQPAAEVKLLQKITQEKIIQQLPVHSSAMGYRRGKSIASHVEPHLSSRYLLKLDFTDFFPSITGRDVRLHLTRHLKHLRSEDVDILERILCWRNKSSGSLCLSIGAPSSPFVSNSVLFDFDTQLHRWCSHQDVRYSRYADDLAFSTVDSNRLKDVKNFVVQTLRDLPYPRLTLNEKKTINVSRRYRRSLVGLILTPDGLLSLGRDRKRLIHSQVYRLLQGQLSATEAAQLRGTLAFAWSVEPTFIASLVNKYGDSAMHVLDLPFRRSGLTDEG